jgi:hypothetical protein
MTAGRAALVGLMRKYLAVHVLHGAPPLKVAEAHRALLNREIATAVASNYAPVVARADTDSRAPVCKLAA